MAGRYTGELFVRVAGDVEAAPAHLSAARALMGEVLEQASFNSLGTHKLERKLADGTLLVAEKIGDLNRVAIRPGGGGARRPLRTLGDFVFSARQRFAADGALRNPPVILRLGDDHEWAAHFYSSDAPGFAEATAAIKGTYIDVFALYRKKTYELGNHSKTWTDADGNTCAYSAPVSPLEFAHRHPSSVYGKDASALGRQVSGVDYTAGGAVGRVVASARTDEYLFVMIAVLGALPQEDRPDVPSAMFDTWAPAKFDSVSRVFQLTRVPLSRRTDELTGVRYLAPRYDAAQVLWAGSLVRAYGLWEFNDDCTELVTYQLPANSTLRYAPGPLGDFDPQTTSSLTNTGVRIALLIGDGSATLQLTQDNTGIYEANGRVLRLQNSGPRTWDFVCGDQVFPAIRLSNVTGSTVWVCRKLLYADLRNRWWVFEETRTDLSLGKYESWFVVVDPDGSEYVEPGDSWNRSISTYSIEIVERFLDDAEAAGATGLAMAYLSVVGTFFAADLDPGDTEPGAQASAVYPTLLAPRPELCSVQGISYGGLGLSFSTERWSYTEGYGFEGDGGLPYHYDSARSLMLSAGCSNAEALAYFATTTTGEQFPRFRYLTGGAVPDVYGGNIAMAGSSYPVGIYLLGKPLNDQPREREIS